MGYTGGRNGIVGRVSAPRHSVGFQHFNMMMIGGGKNDLLIEKTRFISIVFLNLVIQLGITYYFMVNYNKNQKKNQNQNQVQNQKKIEGLSPLFFWVLLIVQLIIMALFAFVNMNGILKFVLFTLFSVLFGISMSGMNAFNTSLAKVAILGTILIFVLMFLVGLVLVYFNIGLSSSFGIVLFFLLLLLILFQLVSIFFNNYVVKGISVFVLILFAIYIVFDTTVMLKRNYNGDYMSASMDYYLDIINIFLNLVNSMN
jgi:FtsH-binding integral membrane protein